MPRIEPTIEYNRKGSLTKPNPKEMIPIQGIISVAANKTSSSTCQNSSRIYVIDLEAAKGEEINNDLASNEQGKTTAPSRGINEISHRSFPNGFDFNKDEITCVTGLLGIAIILGITLLTLVVTCWPQHNVVLSPEYWYEFIPTLFVTWGLLAGIRLKHLKFFINIPKCPTYKSISKFYCLSMFGSVIIFISTYYLWTKCLGFSYPIPHFGGVFLVLNYILVQPLAIWVMFPANSKTPGNHFRKKILLLTLLEILHFYVVL